VQSIKIKFPPFTGPNKLPIIAIGKITSMSAKKTSSAYIRYKT